MPAMPLRTGLRKWTKELRISSREYRDSVSVLKAGDMVFKRVRRRSWFEGSGVRM